MKKFLTLLLLWAATLLAYNIVFALDSHVVACNEAGAFHTVTLGIHSCTWAVGFFALEAFFLIYACIVFFKRGPKAILGEMWEKRGKVALLLLAVVVVVGVVVMGVAQINRAQHPEYYPGPWYDII